MLIARLVETGSANRPAVERSPVDSNMIMQAATMAAHAATPIRCGAVRGGAVATACDTAGTDPRRGQRPGLASPHQFGRGPVEARLAAPRLRYTRFAAKDV